MPGQSHVAAPGALRQYFPIPYLSIAIIAALPWLALSVASNWIYSEPTTIDPWVYHGFFLNLTEFKAHFFQGTYYGTRLPWILPGYLAYQLFSPITANYVLHLSFFYLATFSAYFGMKRLAGDRAALLTTVLLSQFHYFLRAIGWDYIDGPAISYYLLTFCLLTYAATSQQRKPLLLGLSGASWAALVYTNLFCIVFTPILLFHFLGIRRIESTLGPRRFLLRCALWLSLGAAAMTALLGLVNYFIEGQIWFYGPSINYLLQSAGKPNPWKRQTYEWIWNARLVFLFLAAATSVIFIWSHRTERQNARVAAARIWAMSHCGALLLMVVCELKGLSVLEYNHYTSYLIPTAFSALASQAGLVLDRVSSKSFYCFVSVFVLAYTLPQAGYFPQAYDIIAAQHRFLPLGLASLAVLATVLWNLRASFVWLFLAAFCLLHYTIPRSYLTDHAQAHETRESFARISLAAQAVQRVTRGNNIAPFFWYNKRDSSWPEFHALNSIYLWAYTKIAADFPDLPDQFSPRFGAILVIPSANADVLRTANDSLRRTGLRAELLAQDKIEQGGVRYFVTSARLRLNPDRMHVLTEMPGSSADGSQLVASDDSKAVGLPLAGWHLGDLPTVGGTIEPTPEGLAVSTPPLRWGYAAIHNRLAVPSDGEYFFTLKYRLLSGNIVFGALTGDRSRWLVQAGAPGVEGDYQIRIFSVPMKAGQELWLLISNDHPAGDGTSRFVIVETGAFEADRD